MPRKGLTKEIVVNAAIELIEEKGNHAFSINELARKLEVKPASLYNHIKNMAELTEAVGYRIAETIKQSELSAIKDKHKDEALFALCNAYRTFAQEHIDLYKVIMGMQKDKNACTEASCGKMVEPIMKVLSDYKLTEQDKIHWQRILRAVMHGFVMHEYAGAFRFFPAEHDETYRKAIETIALGLHTAEKERENE